MIPRVLALCLLLSATPAAAADAPGAFAPVQGGQVYYETCGSGPETLVLLHDGVVHSAGWDDAWPILCAQFRVVRYDRRGYGRSPQATSPYAAVDDVAAVMAAARVQRATLVGSSNGGGVATDFTLAHPERVERLVLVGPFVSGFRPSIPFILRGLWLFSPMLLGDDVAGTIKRGAKDRYILGPGQDAARARLKALLTANPQNITHGDRQTPTPPARPRLPTITAPTLILVGEADIGDVKRQAAAIEGLIPGARRVVMRGAGHLMYVEQPVAFADEVAGFVRSAPVRGGAWR